MGQPYSATKGCAPNQSFYTSNACYPTRSTRRPTNEAPPTTKTAPKTQVYTMPAGAIFAQTHLPPSIATQTGIHQRKRERDHGTEHENAPHPAMIAWRNYHVHSRPQTIHRPHLQANTHHRTRRVVTDEDGIPLELQWATPYTYELAQKNLVDPLRREPIRLEPSREQFQSCTGTSPTESPGRSLFGKAPQLTVRPRSAPVTVIEFMRASNESMKQ